MLNCATQPGASRLVHATTASHAPKILMRILMAIYARLDEAAP
jgi:hypothetical protein